MANQLTRAQAAELFRPRVRELVEEAMRDFVAASGGAEDARVFAKEQVDGVTALNLDDLVRTALDYLEDSEDGAQLVANALLDSVITGGIPLLKG